MGVEDAPGTGGEACSSAELAAQAAFELPERRAMSLLGLGGLGGGLVPLGPAAPDPTQAAGLGGQPAAGTAPAAPAGADTAGLGSQAAAGAAQSAATLPPGAYQPAVTSTAQS